MVNQDNTKIGICIVAVAGTLAVGYVLYNQWKKKKEDEDSEYELSPCTWREVRRRTGGRGRSSRSGRFVSDPGRVLPVPSGVNREGIYKRQSAGARLSQMPSLASNIANICAAKSEEALKRDYDRNDDRFRGGRTGDEGVDAHVEGVVEMQTEKLNSEVAMHGMTITSNSTLGVLTEPTSEGSVEKTSEQSSPAKYAEGSGGDGGAGEAMATPEESRLTDDQLGVGDVVGDSEGDSEGSDIGAGDSLAEDVTVLLRDGMNLSSASSVGSSPGKSPSKSLEKSPPTMQWDDCDQADSADRQAKLDSESVIRTILQVQKSPNTVDSHVVKVLVELLQVQEEKLLLTALESVTRCAAFSSNQKFLNEHCCPEALSRLLQTQCEALLGGTASSDNVLIAVNNSIMNLSMDMPNQVKLACSVPNLVDLVLHEGTSTSVKLSSLQPLTNLSMTAVYHDQYVRVVPRLYSLVDAANRVIRIQALKVLVNLSCNPDMIPHLVIAKAPKCLMSILDWTADPFLTLRLITLLANIASTVQKDCITAESLPFDENAVATKETVYVAIFDGDRLSLLRSKIQTFTRHDSEDISQQACRLYNSLPKC